MLSGCSFMQSETASDMSRTNQLEHFPQQWEMHGRISIINDKENWYAKFIWMQNGEDFKISFMGPLGETELQLTRIAQNTHLKTPSYERQTHDLEQLLLQETGWNLPINSLRYWSHGVANPDVASRTEYDEQGNISDLYQTGWHIQYPKRTQLGEYYLPKKIIVMQQDIKIKIIISQWDLQSLSTTQQE